MQERVFIVPGRTLQLMKQLLKNQLKTKQNKNCWRKIDITKTIFLMTIQRYSEDYIPLSEGNAAERGNAVIESKAVHAFKKLRQEHIRYWNLLVLQN